MKRTWTLLVLLAMIILPARAIQPEEVKPVKNVILLIPDGTSLATVSLARWLQWYENPDKPKLNIDPYLCGTVRTHSSNAPIGDSAPTTSCYMTGYPSRTGYVSTYPVADPENDIYPMDAARAYQPMTTVLEAAKQEALSAMFKSQLPKMDKTEFYVVAQAMGEGAAPVMITQSEYMRRMKEMANIQAGMSFYGDMPDMFNLVLNADHPLVKEVLAGEEQACAADIVPIQLSMDDTNNRRNALKKSHEGKKDEEIPTAEKDELSELDKKWNELKTKKEAVLAGYAAQNPVVRQLIDLALLQNGMLKGEALNNFVKRSIELIK